MTRPGLTYEEAVAALESALTFGIHPSLEGIARMTTVMERPESTFASVQVAGTNGKTSVTRMTAALLRAHGRRVGCYTSPHMQEYRERIEVDGEPISPAAFAAAIEAALEAAGHAGVAATEFELLTAAALWAFRDAGVDFAVLEVGMGGRWDATSIVSPAVSVVTGVALDHTDHLGTTREAIAEDKASIIRSACAPVLGPGTAGLEDIFLARCALRDVHPRAVRPFGDPSPAPEELTTRFRVLAHPDAPDGHTIVHVRAAHDEYPSLELAAPAYQAANAATAIAAAEAALGRALDPDAVARALAGVRIPGRFEVVALDPWVVVDGAHNPQAAAVLADAIEDAWPDSRARPVLLLAVLADKDVRGIVQALAPAAACVVATQTASSRAMPARELAAVVADVTGVQPRVVASIRAALAESIAVAGVAGVVASGSITTAAEVAALVAS